MAGLLRTGALLGILLLLPAVCRAEGADEPPLPAEGPTPDAPAPAPPAECDCAPEVPLDVPFCPCWKDPDRCSVQFLAGCFASALGPGAAFDPRNPHARRGAPTFDYLPFNARLGYRPFLCPPDSPPLLRDRLQVLLDVEAAPVVAGFGDYVAGPSLLLRSDLTDPAGPLVPYGQVGAGVVFTDAYKDPNQRAVGQLQEFQLQVVGGLRWRLSDHWSLDGEGGWQHISNAGLASRNAGLNSLGGSLGLTYTFGVRTR